MHDGRGVLNQTSEMAGVVSRAAKEAVALL